MLSRNFSILLLIIACGFLVSCEFFLPSKEIDALAKVGDKYLYLKDIEGLTSNQNVDSLEIINSYIESWINEQLILEKALQNLPEDKVNFEKQLENYRNSLIIYAYENQLIREKLDTEVTPHQIKKYYNANPDNFDLKEQVFQVRMVKTSLSAPNKDSLNRWVFGNDSLFKNKLDDYCRSFAKSCILDTSIWVPKNILASYLEKGEEDLLKLKMGENTFEDSLSVTYIQFFNSRKSGELAPISYVKKQIKEIIRNQRRITLLSEVRKQIFESGSLKGKYEIYY